MKRYRFILVVSFVLLLPSVLHAASLELNPPAGSYVVGDRVSIGVLVDTKGASVNAVSGEIRYDPDLLRAVSVSRQNSVVDLWIEEPAVVGGNTVVFEGLILNPGFNGKSRVITINFKVIAEGTAAISFKSGLVLANDGFGTNIVEILRGATLNLLSFEDRTGPGQALPSEGDASLEEEEDVVLPPVVISYTEELNTLNDLIIRGVTYPNAQVNVYLQPEDGELLEQLVISDAGGNFVYNHGEDSARNQLLTANVFSILDALAQPRTSETYQFWLTAIQEGVESESTQPFEVSIRSGLTPLLALSLILLFLALGLTAYVLHGKNKQDKAVMREVKKDIDNLSYDIEKYEAKARQDARTDDINVQ